MHREAGRRAKPTTPFPGWSANYEDTDRYQDLAKGTRIYYDRKLRDIIRVWGDLPVSFLKRSSTSRHVLFGFSFGP